VWLKILRNKSQYPLHHGYYVTRQLTTTERESGLVSWKGGRETEQLFFSEHRIWCLEDPERLGTENLSNALSRLLAEQIRKRSVLSLPILMFSLPTLKNALDTQRRTVEERLRKLPRSFADDPQGKLLELFGEFLSKIDNSVSGTLDLELFQWLKGHFGVLKDRLKKTKPEFDVKRRTNGDDPNNCKQLDEKTGK